MAEFWSFITRQRLGAGTHEAPESSTHRPFQAGKLLLAAASNLESHPRML